MIDQDLEVHTPMIILGQQWTIRQAKTGELTLDVPVIIDQPQARAAVDGIQCVVLSHAQAGLRVSDPEYITGLERAITSVMSHFS